MQDWLNRFGLTLQFAAVFLVTPEILGPDKVQALADKLWVNPMRRIRNFVRAHPVVDLALLGALIVGTIKFEQFLIPDAIFDAVLQVSPLGKMFALLLIVAGYIVGIIAFICITRGLAALFNRVAQSQRSYLTVGALLFTAGFFILMAATFVRSDSTS